MLGTTLPTPLYSLYRERFGFSELMVTVIFATYAAGVIAALLLVGRLSDEIGRRPVLLPGIAFSALSAVVFLLAGGVPSLLVARVLSGSVGRDLHRHRDGDARGFRSAGPTRARNAGRDSREHARARVRTAAGWAARGVCLESARLPFWVDLALLVPAALAIVAMPEPVTVSGTPRLRPQALHVPPRCDRSSFAGRSRGSPGSRCWGCSPRSRPRSSADAAVTSEAVVGLVVFAVFAASAAGQLAFDAVPSGSRCRVGAVG